MIRRSFRLILAFMLCSNCAMGQGFFDSANTDFVVRGFNQGTMLTPGGITGGGGTGTLFSQMTKSRHYSNSDFQKFRVFLPTFFTGGSNPVTEQYMDNNAQFQVGYWPTDIASVTGLPTPRPLVTFNGGLTTIGSYTAGASICYVASDWMSMPYRIPAHQFFDLFTTIETTPITITSLTSSGTTATATVASTANIGTTSVNIGGATQTGYNGTFTPTVISSTQFTYPVAAGLTTPATGSPVVLGIPYGISASNYIQRYLGATGSNIGGTSLISSNAASTATSVSASTSSQTGNTGSFYTPFLIQYEPMNAIVHASVHGDSISYNQDMGYPGSGTNNDSMGDALGNGSYPSIGITENIGGDVMNFSKGGDGNIYLSNTANTPCRRQFDALAKPTSIVDTNGHNDITIVGGLSVPNWALSTTYQSVYSNPTPITSTVLRNGNAYLTTTGGTSASSGNGPSCTSGTCVDGTVTWTYEAPQSLSKWVIALAADMNVHAQYAATWPSVPIYKTTATPYSTEANAISSLSESGTTVTATVASTAGMVGQPLTVTGATPSGYNLTFTPTVISSTQFTYTAASGLTTPATGSPVFSDNWASLAYQTPYSNGWGAGSSTQRGLYDAKIRSLAAEEAITGAFDVNLIVENGWSSGTETSLWEIVNCPYTATSSNGNARPSFDGVHPTGCEHIAASAIFTPGSLQ